MPLSFRPLQTKETLTTRQSDFGSTAQLSDKFMKEVRCYHLYTEEQSSAVFSISSCHYDLLSLPIPHLPLQVLATGIVDRVLSFARYKATAELQRAGEWCGCKFRYKSQMPISYLMCYHLQPTPA